MSAISKIESLQARLDGYKAAFAVIKELMEGGRNKRPVRITLKMQKSAAFRAGLYTGLVQARCMSVWGEFPNVPENAALIRKTLDKKKP